VGSFVAFEALVIAAASLRRRRFTARDTSAATVAQPAL
jgi:hypothetical protein